jgi:hypothetical protein
MHMPAEGHHHETVMADGSSPADFGEKFVARVHVKVAT